MTMYEKCVLSNNIVFILQHDLGFMISEQGCLILLCLKQSHLAITKDLLCTRTCPKHFIHITYFILTMNH